MVQPLLPFLATAKREKGLGGESVLLQALMVVSVEVRIRPRKGPHAKRATSDT
jgi:hypothetical protein